MKAYINFADQFVVWIGRSFAWGIFILTAAVMYEVIMRYFFNAPTLWAFDFTIQMYGAVFMMGGASAMSTKTHVKADMYYNRLSEKRQAILDLILFICFYAPGVFALTYAGYFYAKKAWIVHETSWNSPAQIQIYFSKSLIPIAGLLLLIIGISEIFRCIICIKTGKWPERIDDVEETEKMILRKIQKGESVKGLVS
ncbi:MAG: TRAP transporter small permease subunit [Candidatus Fonsibacter sp.]|nr:TRAP transporter small permease subunit [Candidatus Fonsibacter sp.]